MNAIYSDKRIDGLDGRYVKPSLFVGVLNGVDKCYTDDAEIKKAYELACIKVEPITKKTRSKKGD